MQYSEPIGGLIESNTNAIRAHLATMEGEIKLFTSGDTERLRVLGWRATRSDIQLIREIPSSNLLSAIEETRRVVDKLEQELGTLTPEQREALIVLSLNSVAVLEAEVEALDSRVAVMATADAPLVSSVWNRIKDAVKNAIKAISLHLWQIVCTALTLKEWTVKGSLGSSIFGLGSVEISLKFGK
ncbi:MAG: hypothetical protein FJ139_08040 [Deltaproteobacteria bacterium]|nr:hypothetical protein [Deltaproteobacteria bacterium]